jgi:hypothetical protein
LLVEQGAEEMQHTCVVGLFRQSPHVEGTRQIEAAGLMVAQSFSGKLRLRRSGGVMLLRCCSALLAVHTSGPNC